MKVQHSTTLSLLFFSVLIQAYPRLASCYSYSSPTPKLTTLVRGSRLTGGSNGIIFDKQDRLHIASVFGREIIVMDRNTGDILDRYGVKDGVEGPDDVIFGLDGSLYWTSIITGVIGRRTPNGTVSIVAKLPPGVNPITVSDDGRLFTALCFFGEGLYEVDPEGVKTPRKILEALGGSPVGNCTLNGMDFGPDGLLYGPRFFVDQVVKVDVDTGKVETVAKGFKTPAAVKFNSKGDLFVLDTSPGLLWKVDVKTGKKSVFAKLKPNIDNLAFDSSGRLFVSNTGDGSIVEVKDRGTARVVSKGGLSFPGGVAVVPGSYDESVWVADFYNVYEYSGRTGKIVTSFPITIGVDDLSPATTVSQDGSNLLFSSLFQNTVQVWNPHTKKVVQDYRNFLSPLNSIRFRGDLVVAQFRAGNVVLASGENVSEQVVLTNDTKVPTGLAATERDVWVADWATGRVLQVVSNGKILPTPIIVASGLNKPEGMAVADDGSLLVVETGKSGDGRLVRINPRKRESKTVARGLDLGLPTLPVESIGIPPTYAFSGVAVGRCGAIYIGADRGRILYKIESRPRRYRSFTKWLPRHFVGSCQRIRKLDI